MRSVEVSEMIERPVDEVFAHLEDPRNELKWQSSAREREVLDDGRIRAVEQWLGRKIEFLWEVTEHVQNKRRSLKTISGPFKAELTLTVESANGGTRVTVEAAGVPGGFFGKLTEPVVMKSLERDFRSDLAKLKVILEAGG